MRTQAFEALMPGFTATAMPREVVLGLETVSAAVPPIFPPGSACHYSDTAAIAATTLASLDVSDGHEIKRGNGRGEWTKKMENRFDRLLVGEALGKLSVAQQEEYGKLTNERMKLHHPRSAEEILLEYRRRKVTADMVQAVDEFCRFNETAD